MINEQGQRLSWLALSAASLAQMLIRGIPAAQSVIVVDHFYAATFD